jgi:hypothetical protein
MGHVTSVQLRTAHTAWWWLVRGGGGGGGGADGGPDDDGQVPRVWCGGRCILFGGRFD